MLLNPNKAINLIRIVMGFENFSDQKWVVSNKILKIEFKRETAWLWKSFNDNNKINYNLQYEL